MCTRSISLGKETLTCHCDYSGFMGPDHVVLHGTRSYTGLGCPGCEHNMLVGLAHELGQINADLQNGPLFWVSGATYSRGRSLEAEHEIPQGALVFQIGQFGLHSNKIRYLVEVKGQWEVRESPENHSAHIGGWWKLHPRFADADAHRSVSI